MISVYLAHNFNARHWLKKQIVPALEKKGIAVTARWLHETDDEEISPSKRAQAAIRDLIDIDRAKVLIAFLDRWDGLQGAGKHFELGYATAIQKQVILFGPEKQKHMIFHFLPKYDRVESVSELISLLLGERKKNDIQGI